MIRKTVNKWIKALITENNVDELSQVKDEILDDEIQKVRAVINGPDENISSVLKQCYVIYANYLEDAKNSKGGQNGQNKSSNIR